jgi:hypothetical protein
VRLSDSQLAWAFGKLGVTPAALQAIAHARPRERADQLLDELKKSVKKHFHQAALELHPDRTGNDLQKAELFRILTFVKEELEKMEVPPRPRARPVVGHYVFYSPMSSVTTTSTTSTSYTAPWGNVIFNVHIRG